VTAPQTRTVSAGPAGSDAEAQGIVAKHCPMGASRHPSRPALREPPKNVTLESTADMRRFGQQIYMQTVQNRAMPLGNQTGMTDEERARIGAWIATQ